MSKPKIYIDGKEGTTGLQIYERLGSREDIELLLIDENKRKDSYERKKLIHAADLVFLCLPDAASIEAVELAKGSSAKIIDASTAHRVKSGWDYGLPELSKEKRENIKVSKRVANPGCHATGFITSVYPLTNKGIILPDMPLTAFSLTGYSGGGKKMIASYESDDKTNDLYAPRVYGLNLKHKHLLEMTKICGLENPPVFCPIVNDYYKGMAVTVMINNSMLSKKVTAENIHEIIGEHYKDEKLINVHPFGYDGMISANTFAGKDSLEIIVNGHEDQTIVTALFDNLGKGASGAAVQNMNLMLGFDEYKGLAL